MCFVFVVVVFCLLLQLLSLTTQNCQLGQHIPLERGVGEEGIWFVSDLPASATSPSQPSPVTESSSSGDQQPSQQKQTQGATTASTDDPKTSKRHGEFVACMHAHA